MKEIESFQIGFKQDISSRVKKLYDEAVSAYPTVCSERARYWTQSWKETKGEPPIIRRAKALKNVLEKMTIYILNGELIVGNVASKPRASVVNPEYVTTVLYKEFKDKEKSPNSRKYDHHRITNEVKKELMEEIFPYWLNRTVEYEVINDLSPETVRTAIPSLSDVPTTPPGTEIFLRHGAGHLTVDYEKVLNKGVLSIIEEVKECLAKTDKSEMDKINFDEAVIVTYKAFIKLALILTQNNHPLKCLTIRSLKPTPSIKNPNCLRINIPKFINKFSTIYKHLFFSL